MCTVFAPTNDALTACQADVDSIIGDKAKLTNVLTYHVVAGKLSADEVLKAGKLKSLQGKELTMTTEGGKWFADDAKLVLSEAIECDNGNIYPIDYLLFPPK